MNAKILFHKFRFTIFISFIFFLLQNSAVHGQRSNQRRNRRQLKASSLSWIGMYKYKRHDNYEKERFTDHQCNVLRINYGFKKRQVKFCKHAQKGYAMHAVLKASQAVAYYCQKTFETSRWNCSHVVKLPELMADLNRNNREQAIVHAIGSSALLHEISRRCAQGLIKHCHCGRKPEPGNSDEVERDFEWNGCHDNIDSGEEYAKAFLGYHRRWRQVIRQLKRRKIRKVNFSFSSKPANDNFMDKLTKKILNGHNYEAGIKLMKMKTKRFCKCHGTSGSCAKRLCSRQLLRLDDRQTQVLLKTHYIESNKKVKINFQEQKIYAANGKPIGETDLIHTLTSPDFCLPDDSWGSAGTEGRYCHDDASKSYENHCNNMCCGRGFHTYNHTWQAKCHCVMQNDYRVNCEICLKSEIRKKCRGSVLQIEGGNIH